MWTGFSAVAQTSADMPRIEGESFGGHRLVLPDAASGKVSVLVFGFTKASKAPTTAWANKLSADFGNEKDFEVYQLPVLEDVPHFIRGMVISSMKKGVPDEKRDRFAPILQHESDLKKFVHYNQPDDAYVVLLDRSGKTAMQIHAATPDSAYPQLRSQIQLLLAKK
jgi:ATP10 protein